MIIRTIVRASRNQFFSPNIDFHIGQLTESTGGQKLAIAKPMELETIDNEIRVDSRAPTLSLRPDEAQQLMDELWDVGLRPSAGSGGAGQMAATENHLRDMRALVFKSTGMEPPK